MRKIAVSTTSFGKYDKMPLNLLEDKGFEVTLNTVGRKLRKNEVVELCRDAIGIIAGTETLDGEVIEKLPNLKVISRCGSGLDNIDQAAARKKRIKIFNTPDAPTLAVSELTLGLIVNLLRKITEMHIAVTNCKWEKPMGGLLHKKRVGIIGFGRIGKKVAGLLIPFGCEIAYTDPFVGAGIMGLKCLSLEELLGWADIISIHASGRDNILGRRELQLMKEEAYLINVSRGGIVDENALYQALKEGHLSGAALDVFEKEPYRGPLMELNNVILTPHIGSYAKEARMEMERQAVRNIIKGLED